MPTEVAESDRDRGWFSRTELTWAQQQTCNVLRSGAIPAHIAFIMDGNRRYARKYGYQSVLDGHAKGFEQLSLALKWCRDFGVQYVTVYAFSIENFKRKREEVDGLMELARQKFEELFQEQDRIAEHGVRFRFFGNLSKLPADLQSMVARIELLTEQYNTAHVNVCMAYTSQDEMTRAMQTAVQGVRDGHIRSQLVIWSFDPVENLLTEHDITPSLLSGCLDTADCPDPDLLVRTSGEQRMSDFLLWQSSYSCLHFDNVLWPEFNFWHLAYAVFHYQWHYKKIQEVKAMTENDNDSIDEGSMRRRKFLEHVRSQRRERLNVLIKSS